MDKDLKPKFNLFDRVKLSDLCAFQADWAKADLAIGEIKYNRKVGRIEYSIYEVNEPPEYGFTDGFKEEQLELVNTRATDCREVDAEVIRNEAIRTYHTQQWEVIKKGGTPISPIEWAFDYMHSRNLIRGAVEPIEGLDIALDGAQAHTYTNKETVILMRYGTDANTIIKAAKAYQTMTKGEK